MNIINKESNYMSKQRTWIKGYGISSFVQLKKYIPVQSLSWFFAANNQDYMTFSSELKQHSKTHSNLIKLIEKIDCKKDKEIIKSCKTLSDTTLNSANMGTISFNDNNTIYIN